MKSLSKETWGVNKKTEVLFCAVRVHIALKHINHALHVSVEDLSPSMNLPQNDTEIIHDQNTPF